MNIGFPNNIEAFEFFARFVLSGFVIFLVRNAYVVGERPKFSEFALDIGLYSLVNQLIWRLMGWLLSLIFAALTKMSTAPESLPRLVPGEDLQFYLEVLVLPICIGIVTGKAMRDGWLTGPFKALSIPIVDPVPRAYDHVFSQRDVGFVIVTFRDGQRVYGYYGNASRAGRDPARSEIYLERLYSIDETGQWIEMKPSRSVLVNLSDLRAIEFLNNEGV
jgi:hypothetical protein